jgi:hypothetical protein
MGDSRADAAFLDPPHNVRIGGALGGGTTGDRDFAMESGEMSSPICCSF